MKVSVWREEEIDEIMEVSSVRMREDKCLEIVYGNNRTRVYSPDVWVAFEYWNGAAAPREETPYDHVTG